MESSYTQNEVDPREAGLRRFTLGMSLIFFVITFGDAKFSSNKLTIPWLGELTIGNPWVIIVLTYVVIFYALFLFLYRQCFQKPIPYQLRRWLKEFGVLVEPVEESQIEKRSKQRDLHLSNLKKGKHSTLPFVKRQESVPGNYYSEFFISVEKEYANKGDAIANQAIHRVLGRHFPFIAPGDLQVIPDQSYHHVTISNEKIITKVFGFVEDFIYLLPTVLYLFCILYFLGNILIYSWDLVFQ